jgi:dTDP-4-amino-4,6-dideoxygalactose transaminase
VQAHVGDQGPFPVSADASSRGFYLPSGLGITEEQIAYVCDAIEDVLGPH